MTNSPLQTVTIHTLALCPVEPGLGSYVTCLRFKHHQKEFSRGYRYTTGERMALMGLIAGLTAMKYRCQIQIFTNAQRLVAVVRSGRLEVWQDLILLRDTKFLNNISFLPIEMRFFG